MMYSIDISYQITDNNSSLEENLFSITDKYEDCEWYASDTGPFKKDGINKKMYRNHGFQIESLDTLKNIIKEVNENPFLWIDFCTKEINDGDDCEHIYCSDNFRSQMLPKYANVYDKRIKNYTGVDKEIHNLCKKI